VSDIEKDRENYTEVCGVRRSRPMFPDRSGECPRRLMTDTKPVGETESMARLGRNELLIFSQSVLIPFAGEPGHCANDVA
jgi:hypothetical protein